MLPARTSIQVLSVSTALAVLQRAGGYPRLLGGMGWLGRTGPVGRQGCSKRGFMLPRLRVGPGRDAGLSTKLAWLEGHWQLRASGETPTTANHQW